MHVAKIVFLGLIRAAWAPLLSVEQPSNFHRLPRHEATMKNIELFEAKIQKSELVSINN